MESPEIAVLLTNLKITEIVKLPLRTLIVMCALVTNLQWSLPLCLCFSQMKH